MSDFYANRQCRFCKHIGFSSDALYRGHVLKCVQDIKQGKKPDLSREPRTITATEALARRDQGATLSLESLRKVRKMMSAEPLIAKDDLLASYWKTGFDAGYKDSADSLRYLVSSRQMGKSDLVHEQMKSRALRGLEPTKIIYDEFPSNPFVDEMVNRMWNILKGEAMQSLDLKVEEVSNGYIVRVAGQEHRASYINPLQQVWVAKDEAELAALVKRLAKEAREKRAATEKKHKDEVKKLNL